MKKNGFSFIDWSLIILVSVLIIVNTRCSTGSITKHQPAVHTLPQVRHPLVVSYHELAKKAGLRILNSGGNAFDAFVAVTIVENVLSSGEVTLAGLLSVLIFHAKTNKVLYLDGGYNSVLNPNGSYNPKQPIIGKTVVVPGILAGLESISKRYGCLDFEEVLQPAIEIAKKGFNIGELHTKRIKSSTQKLRSTEYGRCTFFPTGTALQSGEILKQPELAKFLTKIAKQGANYMYRGEWARQCVETVQKKGGLMTLEDLANYQPTWTEPWRMSYRGFNIYASSGRSMFALWALLALKTLEHTNIQQLGHYSTSADVLEVIVRIARTVEKEYWIRDYHNLDNRDLVNSRLTLNYTTRIWSQVLGELDDTYKNRQITHHTLSSIIADKDGNVVCGKHSINSDLWGIGLFVQGVLLNGSGIISSRYTGPGKRRTQGAPNFMIFKKEELKYACGTYSSSNPHAAFQFLVNLLDYGLPADQVVDLPRFGSFPYDEKDWTVDFSKNWLDKRVSSEIVEILKSRGLHFDQESPKLGKGCIAEFFSDGKYSTGYDKIN